MNHRRLFHRSSVLVDSSGNVGIVSDHSVVINLGNRVYLTVLYGVGRNGSVLRNFFFLIEGCRCVLGWFTVGVGIDRYSTSCSTVIYSISHVPFSGRGWCPEVLDGSFLNILNDGYILNDRTIDRSDRIICRCTRCRSGWTGWSWLVNCFVFMVKVLKTVG